MAPFATSPQDHGRGCGNGKTYDDHDARNSGTQPQDTHELDIPKPNGIARNQPREREHRYTQATPYQRIRPPTAHRRQRGSDHQASENQRIWDPPLTDVGDRR